MKAILVLSFICLMQIVCIALQQPNILGIEKATLMGSNSQGSVVANLTNKLRSNVSPLQFRFSSPSYTYGWWCVLMFETTPSWHDNYLCTNRDINLHWIWDRRVCRTDLKCVATAEPADDRWNDNALCLPTQSSIELVWSYCGSITGMECLRLYDPASTSYTHDNHLCWKEHYNL
jgi:hypothetical protein